MNATTLRQAIDALLPEVRERAPEIEASRRIPADLVERLRTAGVFRMLVPPEYGGIGLDYPASVDILTAFARADGAVGWSLMIGCETPQLLALLSTPAFEALYADGPDVVVAGAFAPKGAARETPAGLRVTGRWGFASGCEHADYLFGNCLVDNATDAPPTLRCALLPRSAWQIIDTWDTAGLRGTGSHDIALSDALVPGEMTFDLFGGRPCLAGPLFAAPLLQFSLHIGAVALGIAEGALDDLILLATSGKTRLYGRSAMRDSELFQYRLGETQADLRAARALLAQQVEQYWKLAQEDAITPEIQPGVLQAVAWTARTSARVVDACYTAGGGSAIYGASNLQRRLRDIHTLTQHASVQESVFADNGAALLGTPRAFGL